MATGGMRGRAGETRNQVDKELAEEEAEVIRQSSANLEELRPKMSDKEAFDKLVAVVKVSTANNESVAALKKRIESLGETVVKVAKKAYDLLNVV